MNNNNIIICFISIVISLFTLFAINYLNDYYDNRSLSSINIMNTNYMALRDYAFDQYYINDYKDKINKLYNIFNDKYITARLKYRAGLISHIGEEEIIINGIDIQNDEKVFNLLKNETIDNFNSNNSIIISKSISDILEADINDTVILRLITKDGYYNAEEFTILEVSDKLDYNYAFIDIDNLNNFSGLENAASEIYIRHNDKKIPDYYDDVKNIFGDDFAVYSKKDILGDKYKDNFKLNMYVYLIYFFLLFSIFLFINTYSVNVYKELLLSKLLFSFIGFIISFFIYFCLLKFYFKIYILFDYMYIILLFINIISLLFADIKYNLLEKIFLNKTYKKSNEHLSIISVISASVFIFIFTFILFYISFLGFINQSYSSYIKNENIKNIIRIVKKNTSKNTFLFNGSIASADNNDSIRILMKEIYSLDEYAETENVLNFPVGIVIRTGSISSRVYCYEKNILDNGSYVSNSIIDGEMFDSEKREVIVGKYIADYLKLKNGDALSLIAKASRGWLETGYFYVKGIYDIENMNYDIIGGSTSMSNFIHLKEGNKSPYNESILVFSDDSSMYSNLNNSYILNNSNLKLAEADSCYYNEYNYTINKIIFIFIVLLTFISALISASVQSFMYRILLKYNPDNLIESKKRLNVLYIISLLISIIISMIIIFILFPFSFRFLIFSISLILLSFILSLLITNYNV